MALHPAQPAAVQLRLQRAEAALRDPEGGDPAQAETAAHEAGRGRFRTGDRPGAEGHALTGTARTFARTFLVSLAVYFVALAVHEVMHLVTLYVLGGQGALVVHAWRFTFLPVTVGSFHVQPAQPLAFIPHLIFDFAGPALA